MKTDRFDSRPDIVDLQMRDGTTNRVLFANIDPNDTTHLKFIDIRNGVVLSIDPSQIMMKLTICRYDANVNVHPNAREMIREHFGL